MSTIVNPTNTSQTFRAIDRADVTIYLLEGSNNADPRVLSIAKSFSFNVSKPKTPIQILSQIRAAGFARDPEDRTFSMTELNTYENLDNISLYTEAPKPFRIDIVITNQTSRDGLPIEGSKSKIIQLQGVEFDSQDFSLDANTSEYVINYSGRFTSGLLSSSEFNFNGLDYNNVPTDLIFDRAF